MSPVTRAFCVLAAALLLPAQPCAETIDPARAAQVKSAYLKHIAGLTTWPAAKSQQGRRPIVIGVIGTDPNGVMAPMLSRIGSGDGLQVQGRPLEVVRVDIDSGDADPGATVRACDVLFLTEGGEASWARLKPLIGREPIVTVSEVARFAEDGGMIEYLIDAQAGKVRLVVNLDAVRRAGIVLSARFLALESVTVLNRGEEA